MRESEYQNVLIHRIKVKFPKAVILKNDANYIQGIPDLLVLYKDKWAMLECKKSYREKRQPNQEYYIRLFNDMSFASFIDPTSEEEVLDALQRAFGA